jgi:hypothetical protein
MRSVLLASAWLCVSGAAFAQDSPTLNANTRCAIVGLAAAGTGATDEQRQAGSMLSLFYIGRIQGEAPNIDLEQLIRRYANQMSTAEVEAERIRCSTEFRELGEALIEMGGRMQQDGAGQKT